MGMRFEPADNVEMKQSAAGDDTGVRPAAIEIHIEELVLHGFQASDKWSIGDAVKQELARLLGNQKMPALLHRELSADRLDAGSFKVTPNAKPRSIGTQLAQSVHQRLSSQQPSLNAAGQTKDKGKSR